jgi:hypothetical protein
VTLVRELQVHVKDKHTHQKQRLVEHQAIERHDLLETATIKGVPEHLGVADQEPAVECKHEQIVVDFSVETRLEEKEPLEVFEFLQEKVSSGYLPDEPVDER